MKTFCFEEGTLLLPGSVHDQSVNIYVSDMRTVPEFSFVVTRQRMEPGQDLKSYVNSQIRDLDKRMPDFHLIRLADRVLDGRAAVETEFTWRADDSGMHQIQVYLAQGAQALILTGTTKEELYQRHEAMLRQCLASFRHRQR